MASYPHPKEKYEKIKLEEGKNGGILVKVENNERFFIATTSP